MGSCGTRRGSPTRACRVVRGEELPIEYIDGDFRDVAQWNLEPTSGGTRVGLRWCTTPAGRLGTVAAFLSDREDPPVTMKAGVENLSAYPAGGIADAGAPADQDGDPGA